MAKNSRKGVKSTAAESAPQLQWDTNYNTWFDPASNQRLVDGVWVPATPPVAAASSSQQQSTPPNGGQGGGGYLTVPGRPNVRPAASPNTPMSSLHLNGPDSPCNMSQISSMDLNDRDTPAPEKVETPPNGTKAKHKRHRSDNDSPGQRSAKR